MTDRLLLAVTAAVTDAIVVADAEGTILLWTGGAERVLGWTAAEIVGRPLTTIVPSHLRAAHQVAFSRVAGGGPARLIGRSVELEALHERGTSFPIELTLGRGSEAAGAFFVGVIRDISERRAVAAELERSVADLDQFAAIASHDLAAPLQIVGGYLELLERRHGERLGDEARQFVAAATDAVGEMRELISALLLYARVGAAAAQPAEVDVRGLTVDVAEGLAAAAAQGVEIRTGDLPRLTTDRTLLRQVLQNLLSNAVRHAAAVVSVDARPAPGGWRIAVGDDGPGIDGSVRGHVLDMFVRGEDGGTGIGLAIVRRSVERLGGTVEVGTSPLGGAELAFTLPSGQASGTPSTKLPGLPSSGLV